MATPSRSQWARWGFYDPERAESSATALDRCQAGLAGQMAPLCAATADPDGALSALAGLIPNLELPDPADPGWARLASVLGASPALARWLLRRPADAGACLKPVRTWTAEDVRQDVLERIGWDGLTAPPAGTDELRWAYRWHLMRIAAADLAQADPAAGLESVSEQLSDLADAVMAGAVAIARGTVPGHEKVRFAVVGLGKTGAREANYLSDVDVLFVGEPQAHIDVATRLAAQVTAICSSYTAAGTIWDIDTGLRPEGATGALVRTLAGLRTYYTTWARNWEFQAMLKARPMAGDPELAAGFTDVVSPLVWSAGGYEGFVAEAQAMRARVVSLIPPAETDREIKLSAGGLRDTEFSVQMLQLVHGRTDERLRVAATLPALRSLVDFGYVGRADGADLQAAYRFQRLLEHRLQLYGMRRTHLMPSDEPGLRRLARSVGMGDGGEVRSAWRSSARTVLKLHQRIYYSPLLEAVARIPTDEIRLTPEAAAARLKALGYADPQAALRHIAALTSGMSRSAEIMRQLLPALLEWIAAGPNPDAGLLGFRQVAEALGATPFFLRALRDEGQTAQNLARVLSSSRYAATLLQRSPSSVELLVGPGAGWIPGHDELTGEFAEVLARYGSGQRTGEIIRATRRRELLRLAMADVLGQAQLADVGEHLSDLGAAALDAALAVARQRVEGAPRMCVIALGRWGGRELSYSSDLDVMVVAEDNGDPQAVNKATQVLDAATSLLSVAGPDPDLVIDLGLRPEGKDGPVVRTLSSYRAYYEKWSQVWETQALLRARHGAGDEELSAAFIEMVTPVRYPGDGLTQAQLTEIRRLKARMEAERIGRGVDPRDHIKLGPGGLSDVEWTVQCLQLCHAWQIPELRVTGTLEALDAACQAGLVTAGDRRALQEAYELGARIRNATTLVRNKGSDVLPANAGDLAQVAQVLGYGRAQGSHLQEDWYKLSRRALAVVNRLFWGQPD